MFLMIQNLIRMIILIIILQMLGMIFYDWNFSRALLPDHKASIGTYDDGQGSTGELTMGSDSILFDFQVGEAQHPYTGLSIRVDSTPIQFNEYCSLELNLKTQKAKKIPIILNEAVPGFTFKQEKPIFRPFTYILDLEEGEAQYQIDLGLFRTPSWWMIEHKDVVNELPKLNLKNIHTINFQNGILLEPNQQDRYTLKSLRLMKSSVMRWRTIAVLLVLLGLFELFFFFYKKRQGPRLSI